MAPADSTQLGQIFFYSTLETNVAHSDYPPLIACIKVCASRHQSLRQTQALMKIGIIHENVRSLYQPVPSQSHMPHGYAHIQLTSTVNTHTHTLKMLPRPAFGE